MQWKPISEVPPEYKEVKYWLCDKPVIVGWAGQDRFETARWRSEPFRKGRREFWCWDNNRDHAAQAANQPTHFMIPDPIPAPGDAQ